MERRKGDSDESEGLKSDDRHGDAALTEDPTMQDTSNLLSTTTSSPRLMTSSSASDRTKRGATVRDPHLSEDDVALNISSFEPDEGEKILPTRNSNSTRSILYDWGVMTAAVHDPTQKYFYCLASENCKKLRKKFSVKKSSSTASDHVVDRHGCVNLKSEALKRSRENDIVSDSKAKVPRKSTITFIQTGGTIDKDYPRLHSGYAFEIQDPACRRILERLNPSFKYNIVSACRKDSLDLTDDDLEKIGHIVHTSTCDKIIITHGTDKMDATAAYLSKVPLQKTVVITGALRPERFSNSDADVNLGVAIAAVQILSPGVYVCTHGIIIANSEICRDANTGKFYKKKGRKSDLPEADTQSATFHCI